MDGAVRAGGGGGIVKPCPFCGKQPEYTDYSAQPYFVFPHEVACNNPGCPVNPSRADKSREDAIKQWNTRPIEDALLEVCEKAREWLDRFGAHSPTIFGGEAELDEQLRAVLAQAKGLVAHESERSESDVSTDV